MFNFFKNKLFGQKGDQKPDSNKKGSNGLTLDDFAKQLETAGNLQNLKNVNIPGMPKLTDVQIKQGQQELAHFKKILKVMTPEERQNPDNLDVAAKDRIAQAAGVAPKDIDQMLKKFEQSKRFVKLFKRFGPSMR
jgi:signal recognition particle subunit SRP54